MPITQDVIMTPSQSRISFKSLPAEIRNKIYIFAFSNCLIHVDETMWILREDPTESNPNDVTTITFATGLVSASRQICQEATSVIYGCNEFTFVRQETARKFFDVIGHANRRLVRNVKIGTYTTDEQKVEIRDLLLEMTDVKDL